MMNTKIYNKVQAVVNNMTDNEADTFIETIGNRLFSFPTNKTAYNKAWRIARKYGLTLAEAETWYMAE